MIPRLFYLLPTALRNRRYLSSPTLRSGKAVVTAVILLACMGLALRGAARMRHHQARPPYPVGRIDKMTFKPVGRGPNRKEIMIKPSGSTEMITCRWCQPLRQGDQISIPENWTLSVIFYPSGAGKPARRAALEAKVRTIVRVENGRLEVQSPQDIKPVYTVLPAPLRPTPPMQPPDPRTPTVYARTFGRSDMQMGPFHAVLPPEEGKVTLRWGVRGVDAANMNPFLTVYHSDRNVEHSESVICQTALPAGTASYSLSVVPGGQYLWRMDIDLLLTEKQNVRFEGAFRVLTEAEARNVQNERKEARKPQIGDDDITVGMREISVYKAHDLLTDARNCIEALLSKIGKGDDAERQWLMEMQEPLNQSLLPQPPSDEPTKPGDAGKP